MSTTLLSGFLKDEATGTETSHIGDYSITPRTISYTAPAGYIAIIQKLSIAIEDIGAPDSGKYGNALVLTNGISMGISDVDGLIGNLTNGTPIKTNGDYVRYAQSVEPISFGAGNTFVKVYHQFESPIILEGDRQEKLFFELADNFTGLVSHTFYISGILVKRTTTTSRMIYERYLHALE